MEINNDLKRVKTKLKLFEQDGVYGLLLDLIDEIDKEGEKGDKIMIIQKVRHAYLKFIRDNEKKDSKQLTIEI